MDLDFILRANPDYVEDLYRQYLRAPHTVGADWAHFFAGFEYGADGRPAAAAAQAERQLGVFDLVHSYRELGHLVADLDPLGDNRHRASAARAVASSASSEADLDRVVECPAFRGATRAHARAS